MGSIRSFFRVQFGHAPVIEILAAAHGVGEMNAPVVAIVDVAHRRRHPTFRHHGVGFAEQRFRNHRDLHACRRRLHGRSQPCAARADDENVALYLLIISGHR